MFAVGTKIQDGYGNKGTVISVSDENLSYPIKILFDKFAHTHPDNFDYFAIDGRKPSCQSKSKQNISVISK